MSKTIKCAVIGHPISHSKSPIIHQYWINKHDLNASYVAIDIAPHALEDNINQLIEQGFTGFNVTIPHKESIAPYCETIDEHAKNIGAVNTVVIKNQKLHGLNTDGFGFLQNIWDSAPDYKFKGKCAVIIGAGGAARAIIAALITQNIGKIIIANRTRENAIALQAMSLCIETIDWQNRGDCLAAADILVNTSSLGMTGQPALELDLSALPASTIVNDIVYAPLQPPLLQNAKARGNLTITGIGMLLHQARPAFEQWFGILPQVSDELRERVLK